MRTLEEENQLLKTELAAERFMIDQITKLNSSEIISDGIQEMLGALGEYVHADRSYVFEITDNYITTNTYEWCAPGVTPQIDNLKGITFEEMPQWIEIFLKGETILIDHLEDVRESMPQEYELLKVQNIQTLIAFPISLHDHLIGFVGLDNPEMGRSRLIERMLYLLGQHVGTAIDDYKKERIRLEMAAAKSRQEYKRDMENILGGAQIGIWSIEMTHDKAPRMYADRTMCELLGVHPSISPEDCYDVWFAGISPNYVAAVLDNVDTVRREGYSEITYTWNHPTRGLIWVRCGGVFFHNYPDGGFLIRGYHQDVTASIRSELRYQSLTAATSQIYYAIYTIDLKRDYMEQLSTANALFPLSDDKGVASEKIGRICKKYVREDYQPKLQDFFDLSTLQERLTHNRFVSREYPGKDGLWKRATFIVPEYEDGTDFSQILYVTQVIDEYKQKELAWQQELVQAADEARRANAAKSDFLSRMSHDIRTPINGIMGLLDMEELNPDNPEKVQECHDRMRICASHLLALINDVLDMNKLESGELILEQTPFDLRMLLKDCWMILESQAAKMNISFEPIAEGSITKPYVIGSPLHVRQIFTNILSNSIKYNKPNGKISVSARLAASTEDSVSYEFVISDTGIGMASDYLEHIFEPFSQEQQGARTTYQGTGLGMSIVHRLVESMNGSIRVESEKNVGSRFIFTLPFQLDPSPKSLNPAEAEQPTADISGMHVLIVEDNDLNREIAQYLLEDAGATVTTVCNGLEAYEEFVSSPPETFDLILMDIMMPVMDGLEATTKIRACDRPDALVIPIVAMSANAFSDDVLASKKAGMNEHLAKPLELHKLIQVLARFRV